MDLIVLAIDLIFYIPRMNTRIINVWHVNNESHDYSSPLKVL